MSPKGVHIFPMESQPIMLLRMHLRYRSNPITNPSIAPVYPVDKKTGVNGSLAHEGNASGRHAPNAAQDPGTGNPSEGVVVL